jgi:hypothetical protein
LRIVEGYIFYPSTPALGRGANTTTASPRLRQRRTHRDVHQLPSLRPPSPATQGSPSSRPVLARRPGAVGLVADEVYPRCRYPCRHLIEHLGSQLLAQVRAAHGWPHAGVATANPPGSTAASHSRPRPAPHQAAPAATGSHAAANGGQATARAAGIQAAPAIQGSRAAGPD